MLRVLGRHSRLCDGVTRRDLLQVGALSALAGVTLPRALQAEAVSGRNGTGPAKSVILVNLLGGPSHLDMFDMKPAAPPEIRGEFQPIDTSVPGLQICEHLPLTARTMHHSALIRTHSHLYDTHSPYNLLTGYSGPVIVDNLAKATDQPSIGAVMQHAGLWTSHVPGYVWMPSHPGHTQSRRRAGPYGGFLGRQYDPLFTTYEATFDGPTEGRNVYINPPVPIATPELRALDGLPTITVDRVDRRRSLLQQLGNGAARFGSSVEAGQFSDFQQRAFDLLTSSRTRQAFDLSREPPEVHERYGRNLFGACMLTARRLIEAGTRFVGVTTESLFNGGIGPGQWDTHSNNFQLLRNFNLPVLDRNYSALVEDLADRGLLDSTLVVLMGEMGRTPKVNGSAGRDHWTRCGFIVLTGAGVRRGVVFGKSDKQGAWPLDHPVSSADHVATIYQLLGLDPHMLVPDRNGRPISISLEGEPVWDVIA